jgi:endonuclease-8
MPEGDTIYRAAATMHRVLAGRQVERFESVFPALSRVDEDHPITGRTIQSVSARGKHLLVEFSGDLILRTHMRMNGSWHLYRPDDRWQRPLRDMRIVVATANAVAVGFNIPVAEFIPRRQMARSGVLQALGPDLLGDSFDRAEAVTRIRAHASEPIGDVLLNQRVVAGIGNVFKSEILFMAGVAPSRSVATLSDAELDTILDISLKQLRANVADRARTLAPTSGRRTTGSLHPSKGLWVYGRNNQPCRKCGAPIRVSKAAPDARLTYWCPNCQP